MYIYIYIFWLVSIVVIGGSYRKCMYGKFLGIEHISSAHGLMLHGGSGLRLSSLPRAQGQGQPWHCGSRTLDEEGPNQFVPSAVSLKITGRTSCKPFNH